MAYGVHYPSSVARAGRIPCEGSSAVGTVDGGSLGGTPPKDRTPAHEGSKSVPGASQAELPEGPRLSNSVSAKMENEVVTETRDSD